MPLYRDDLLSGHYLHARCHPSARARMSFPPKANCIRLECMECQRMIANVAVDFGSVRPSEAAYGVCVRVEDGQIWIEGRRPCAPDHAGHDLLAHWPIRPRSTNRYSSRMERAKRPTRQRVLQRRHA